jgi:poly-gamma-glutamate synthesis protein (capsule biosynthesis protein)
MIVGMFSTNADQIRDAARMTGAGAVIVSGSQAHQPQAFEFSEGGFVHHGLGNLFFGQLDISEPTRQGFIDRHIFYDGRHISTELITIYFIDYARARLMAPQERAALLKAVFSASGW